LSEQVGRLQQQALAQAQEQQRQLSYVQSMHQWAGRIASSMRQLQQQNRSAAAAASVAQEEAAGAKASLVQLAALHDSSMQQVCQLSLEVSELKEQMQLVLMEAGGSGGGKQPRRRAAAAPAGQQQQEPGLQPRSPKRAKAMPRVATAGAELATAGAELAAAAGRPATTPLTANRQGSMLGGRSSVGALHLQLQQPVETCLPVI
jgi:hypothetical protein